MTITTHY